MPHAQIFFCGGHLKNWSPKKTVPYLVPGTGALRGKAVLHFHRLVPCVAETRCARVASWPCPRSLAISRQPVFRQFSKRPQKSFPSSEALRLTWSRAEMSSCAPSVMRSREASERSGYWSAGMRSSSRSAARSRRSRIRPSTTRTSSTSRRRRTHCVRAQSSCVKSSRAVRTLERISLRCRLSGATSRTSCPSPCKSSDPTLLRRSLRPPLRRRRALTRSQMPSQGRRNGAHGYTGFEKI